MPDLDIAEHGLDTWTFGYEPEKATSAPSADDCWSPHIAIIDSMPTARHANANRACTTGRVIPHASFGLRRFQLNRICMYDVEGFPESVTLLETQRWQDMAGQHDPTLC